MLNKLTYIYLKTRSLLIFGGFLFCKRPKVHEGMSYILTESDCKTKNGVDYFESIFYDRGVNRTKLKCFNFQFQLSPYIPRLLLLFFTQKVKALKLLKRGLVYL